MPALARPTPGRSRLRAGPWLSVRLRAASGSSASPIGTLSQKIQCHEMPSTIAPPTTGPSATPRPEMPDHAPIARPRFSVRERVGEQRQRERGDDGGADALEGAGGDQRAGRGRECSSGGGGGEDGEADEEHPAAAEAVAERGAGEQQDGVRERVRVDRPLERLDRRAEILADRRQRVGDDQVVEDDHEEGDRDDREGPSGRERVIEVSIHSLAERQVGERDAPS